MRYYSDKLLAYLMLFHLGGDAGAQYSGESAACQNTVQIKDANNCSVQVLLFKFSLVFKLCSENKSNLRAISKTMNAQWQATRLQPHDCSLLVFLARRNVGRPGNYINARLVAVILFARVIQIQSTLFYYK